MSPASANIQQVLPMTRLHDLLAALFGICEAMAEERAPATIDRFRHTVARDKVRRFRGKADYGSRHRTHNPAVDRSTPRGGTR